MMKKRNPIVIEGHAEGSSSNVSISSQYEYLHKQIWTKFRSMPLHSRISIVDLLYRIGESLPNNTVTVLVKSLANSRVDLRLRATIARCLQLTDPHDSNAISTAEKVLEAAADSKFKEVRQNALQSLEYLHSNDPESLSTFINRSRVGISEWSLGGGWLREDRPPCDLEVAETIETIATDVLEHETKQFIGRSAVIRITLAVVPSSPIWPVDQIQKTISRLCHDALRSKPYTAYRKTDAEFSIELILFDNLAGIRQTHQPMKEQVPPVFGGNTISQQLDAEPTAAREILFDLSEELNELQLPFREKFQQTLHSLEGQSFGSLESNREIAGIIQATADRLNQVFCCINCGEPSRLRCGPAGNSKTGIFCFEHTVEQDGKRRRVNHSATGRLPVLKMVPPREDLRKKQKRLLTKAVKR